MIENYETIIIGPSKCILVPYRYEHVLQYHEWMKQIELLHATNSEALTLQEEYEMQCTWKNDTKKCTFIILSKEKVIEIYKNKNLNHHPDNNNNDDVDNEFYNCLIDTTPSSYDDVDNTNCCCCTTTTPPNFIQDTLSAMVGDVNLFLSPYEEDDENDNDNHHIEQQQYQYQQAEIDIMIANQKEQRQGYGSEAVLLMMYYSTQRNHNYQDHTDTTTTATLPNLITIPQPILPSLYLCRFFCKINETNHGSIRMFTNPNLFHFYECSYAECFQQYEYESKYSTPIELQTHVKNLVQKYIIQKRKQQQPSNLIITTTGSEEELVECNIPVESRVERNQNVVIEQHTTMIQDDNNNDDDDDPRRIIKLLSCPDV